MLVNDLQKCSSAVVSTPCRSLKVPGFPRDPQGPPGSRVAADTTPSNTAPNSDPLCDNGTNDPRQERKRRLFAIRCRRRRRPQNLQREVTRPVSPAEKVAGLLWTSRSSAAGPEFPRGQ